MIKDTMKRKKPSFNEAYHGYRTFSELLEDAQKEGLLELEADKRSRTYVVMRFGAEAKEEALPTSKKKRRRRSKKKAGHPDEVDRGNGAPSHDADLPVDEVAAPEPKEKQAAVAPPPVDDEPIGFHYDPQPPSRTRGDVHPD